MNENRIHPRLLCSELVKVERLSASDESSPIMANLEDISRRGACVSIETAIEPGDHVLLCYADGELPGVVRYCTDRDLEYLIGIEFSYGCEWPADFYQPEHLLDPETLRSPLCSPRQMGLLPWVGSSRSNS
jgi:hypothetical protein